MKFYQIAISVSVGMSAGCIPIVGYNMGAGRHDRTLVLLKYLIIAEAAVGVAALLAAEIFPHRLINIFGAKNESVYYTDFAVKSFRVYLCTIPISMVNKGTFIYLQAMGKALQSTAISMTREIVFGVSLPILMPIIWGMDGILYSFPLSDILTLLIVAVIIAKIYKSETKAIAAQSPSMP